MSNIVRSDLDLRRLEYSPNENPLIHPKAIPIKRKQVKTGIGTDLINSETAEITAASFIHQIEEKDDEHFVKVFAAGVSASFELNRTAARVFQAVLHEYEKSPLSKGFAESVYLAWFDDGLSGRDIGMSEKTFQRGLKVLLDKGFLAPKTPNVFWVNPALFFKGNRVMFIREYVRKKDQTKLNEDKKETEDNNE